MLEQDRFFTANKPSSEYDYLFKAQLIGDHRVGKSQILLCSTGDKFEDRFIGSIDRPKIKTIDASNKTIKFQIWDTVWNTRNSDNIAWESIYSDTSYYPISHHVYFVVFDLTDQTSFSNAKKWIDLVEKTKTEAKIILIGNKSDLADRRVVDDSAIKEYLNTTQGINFYIETSAKTGEKLELIYQKAADLLVKEHLANNESSPDNINSSKCSIS